jgi:hypothetical protein
MRRVLYISALLLLLVASTGARAQNSVNDTIRLGAVVENGQVYPMILLDEYTKVEKYLDPAEKLRRDRLRNDIFTVYPYAITAAAVFKGINDNLEKMDGRHDRKKYLKSIDHSLDQTFKQPLKNLSIDQGHILIKLINRQTGQNCYSIVKELKGGFSAVVWQGVGVLFNNNLNKDYDPEGSDKEIEEMVKDMEASSAYRYQLYQQDLLMRKMAIKK